jgi:ankyrin repeat protein
MKQDKKRLTILNIFDVSDLTNHALIHDKLRKGLGINTVDSGGRTLLMEAVVRKDHDLMKLLVDQGADPNIRDKREWTALHFAAQNCDLFATKLLVKVGADVNAKDDCGNNVILRAVMNSKGNGDVIRFLKSHGAEISEKNKSDISALDLAKNIFNYNLLPFLET